MRALAAAAFAFALVLPSFAQNNPKFELEEDDEPQTVVRGNTTSTTDVNRYVPKNADDLEKRRGLMRKAERKANKADIRGNDGTIQDFDDFSVEDQKVIILAIAYEIARIRKLKGIHWVQDADIRITVGKDKSLEQLKKDKAYLKNKSALVVKTVDSKEVTPPVTHTEPVISDTNIGPAQKLFEDNKWDLLEDSPEAVEMKKKIDEELAKLTGPNDYVSGLHVVSSASTLRSTAVEDGRPIDNLRLSQLRAEAAKAFIRGHLKSKGFELPDGLVTVDFAGSNGNGTSGPNDPYGNGSPGKGEPYRLPNGQPDLASYAQHRYVLATLTFYREVGKTVVDEVEKTACSSAAVDVDVDYEKLKIKPPKIKLPPLRIGAFFKRLFSKKPNTWDCPKF